MAQTQTYENQTARTIFVGSGGDPASLKVGEAPEVTSSQTESYLRRGISEGRITQGHVRQLAQNLRAKMANATEKWRF